MVVYNFKKIAPVPTSKDFVDIILSKTQRQTPTVVHKQYHIARIRAFYMRKVKFTQQAYEERIARILDEFPRLNDIHPFYADLMNVLYDRDHYKLALGQLNMARGLIDRIGKDYLRLLKYGDSLYRCKQLKRAGLGRMCTLMKKLKSSLDYLEQVRQHLARLPSIDPNTRTLLVCGYPNVGKSSFMNKVTRAECEVQPYAFTTKSLFVGHMDYKYLRWQVIDTPGILDHSLEERNTIEMQSVTALVHLKASILYFIDLSEQCGYSIKQQISLFHNIKPLFEGKPLMVVLNKSDMKTVEQCTADEKAMVKTMEGPNTTFVTCSTLTEEGVMGLKTTACDALLAQRVATKSNRAEKAGDSIDELAGIHVAIPEPRDRAERPPVIPSSVQARVAQGLTTHTSRKLQKEIMIEHGGAGVYSMDFREQYLGLKDEDWKFDSIPEIMDGKNIADFVDPEIERMLEELEREEEELEAKGEYEDDPDALDDGLTEVEREQLKAVRRKRVSLRHESELAKSRNHPTLPRTVAANRRGDMSARGRSMDAHLEELGYDEDIGARKRARELSQSRGRSRTRKDRMEEDRETTDGMEVDGGSQPVKKQRLSTSRARDKSVPRDEAAGAYKDKEQREQAKKKAVKVIKNLMRQKGSKGTAKKGEGDRHVPNFMPKHLLSGKRRGNKTSTIGR
jgi:nucleolar GTP-binding protein